MTTQSFADEASETTPLLRALSPIAEPSIQAPPSLIPHPASTTDVDDADKPLPKGQIFFLCVGRVIEPIAYFSIFPFINQMIWETGEMEKEDVGYYSGLIVGLPLFHITTKGDRH